MLPTPAAGSRPGDRWAEVEAPPRAQRRQQPAAPAPTLRTLLITGLLSAGAGTYLGFTLVDEPEDLSACWVLQATIFLALAIFGQDGWRSQRLRRVLGVLAALYLIGGLLAGRALAELLWLGVANAVGAAAGVRVYRCGPHRSWLPRDLGEFLWLWLAAAVAPVVTHLLGGFPGVSPWRGEPIDVQVWCLLRQTTILTAAVNCLLPSFFVPADQLLRPKRRIWRPAYVVVATTCVAAPHLWPALPLSWVMTIPAIMAGALMTRRSAGLAVLAIGVVSIWLPYPTYEVPPMLGVLPPGAAMDVLLAFLSVLAMIIVMSRERGAHLLVRYHAHADAAVGHREIRDGVLQAMSDGLLLTDPAGRVMLSNGALTHLLGDAPPDVVTLDWARQAQLQAADVDRLLGAPEFTRLLHPRVGGANRSVLAVPGGPAGNRRLAVTTQDMLVGPEAATLWLVRDATLTYAQERDLEAFAGRVAGDLKRPLAALAAWMEAAEDQLTAGDPAAACLAMDRAQDAIAQMRRVIDGYLAAAVHRGGELRLTDVPLADVVREICAAYAASDRGRKATFDVQVRHVVHADAALTKQLLANLIGVGLGNHPPGRPPYVRIRSAVQAPGWTEVQIADRGDGLPRPATKPASRPALPESADPSPGMTLCRAIISRHGGWITAERNEWGGATFRFTLPLATRAEVAW